MNYQAQMEHAAKRRAKIVKLYQQTNPRLSMDEIGLRVEPNISRQRVRQIVIQEGLTTRR